MGLILIAGARVLFLTRRYHDDILDYLNIVILIKALMLKALNAALAAVMFVSCWE